MSYRKRRLTKESSGASSLLMVVRFSTHMTGEVFAIMRQHSILGRMMREAQVDEEAFATVWCARATPADCCITCSACARLACSGQLADESSASYLSGLLIGHELASIPRLSETVYVLASEQLAARYVQALSTCGISALVLDSDAAVNGLFRLSASLPKD